MMKDQADSEGPSQWPTATPADLGTLRVNPAPVAAAGQRVGTHVLLRELGRGGMGVVWEAQDERLHRNVALKSLPALLATDKEALARLEAEARALAAVNHPHVATLHGIEEGAGTHWLVMELVAGETLAALLKQGALPVERALSIARQVAAGLEAAHAQGLVHRDLKPSNVKLGSDGAVKILDFGLARRVRAGEVARPGEGSAGTPGYMSPEQVRGDAVDERSDLFALGCLLFEALAGQPAFGRGAPTERLSATLEQEPPWRALPATLSQHVRDVCVALLEKSPQTRMRSATEARIELERILAWRDFADAAAGRSGATPHNLPAPRTTFVGREDEQREVTELVQLARLVTLSGTGGAGKTRLGIEVARALLPLRRDGCWLVELAAIGDGSQVPMAVAKALGTPLSAQPDLLAELLEWLAGSDRLVVLDNCEHLREACADLARALLIAAPRLTILATSREPLRVPGESIRVVQPFAAPTESPSLEALLANDAVRLLVDRAAREGREAAVSASDVAHVAAICRSLEGLPLALEMAAARVRATSWAEVAESLADRLAFPLESGGATAPRHQTLRTTLEWSHGLLEPSEQLALRRLAVFAGGVDLELALPVVGLAPLSPAAVPALLDSLAAKSFVQRVEAEGRRRLVMLESVRELAVEKLRESDEEPSIRDAHLLAMERYATPFADQLRHAQGPARQSLERESMNFAAALSFASTSAERARLGLSLCMSTEVDDHARGRTRERERTLASILEALPPDDAASRAKALHGIAICQYHLTRPAEALVAVEQAIALARQIDSQADLSLMLNSKGEFLRAAGRAAEARVVLEQALRVSAALGDQRRLLNVRVNLAHVHSELGDHEAALAAYEEALPDAMRSGRERAILVIRVNTGEILRRLGRDDAMRAIHLDVVPRIAELGDFNMMVVILEQAARARVTSKSAPRIAKLLGALDAINRRLGRDTTGDTELTEGLAAQREACVTRLGAEGFEKRRAAGEQLDLASIASQVVG